MGNQSEAADILSGIAETNGESQEPLNVQPMTVSDDSGNVINLTDDGTEIITK